MSTLTHHRSTHDSRETWSLGASLHDFGLTERQWCVLEARFGFVKHLTLEETGFLLGQISRERVRQIQRKTILLIDEQFWRLIPVIMRLEENARSLWSPFDKSVSLEQAIRACQQILTCNDNREHVSPEEVKRLLIVLRSLVSIGKHRREAQFTKTWFAVCALPPVIEDHEAVIEELARQQKETKEWSYRQLVVAVLKEANRPLHWSEIVERAEKMKRRQRVSPHSLSNVLLDTETFARVDQGTYGLKAWGLETVDPYTEIIAAELKSARRALTFGDLLQRVCARREISETSLQMYLWMHPRFYQSVDGLYGLRAWLPPREKQTLRTPSWLVEGQESYERVPRAIVRKYDVQGIIARDRSDT